MPNLALLLVVLPTHKEREIPSPYSGCTSDPLNPRDSETDVTLEVARCIWRGRGPTATYGPGTWDLRLVVLFGLEVHIKTQRVQVPLGPRSTDDERSLEKIPVPSWSLTLERHILTLLYTYRILNVKIRTN